FASQVEFDVDVIFVGVQGADRLLEITAVINNKGGAGLDVADVSFELRTLQGDTLGQGSDRINFQTDFAHLLWKAAWLPPSLGGTSVEPNTVQRYSYAAHVPMQHAFLLLHGRVEYGVGFIRKRSMVHTAHRLLAVPHSSELAKP